MTLMMIVNPAAGKGKYEDGLPFALKLLSMAGYETTVFFTEYSGHATELAEMHADSFDRILVLGGDGTLGEVISGLLRLERRPEVGYIPIGTANDIARTLSLPKNDIAEGVVRFIRGKPFAFDAGITDKGSFNYVAAFGAFTEVSYATKQSYKRVFGEAAYLAGALAAVSKLRSYHVRVTHDGGELEGDFLYGGLSNSYSVGGIVKLPKDMVELSDGMHELIMIKKISFCQVLKLAREVLSGDFSSEHLVILRTSKASFSFDEPVAWSIDGENGGEVTELALRNEQGATTMII